MSRELEIAYNEWLRIGKLPAGNPSSMEFDYDYIVAMQHLCWAFHAERTRTKAYMSLLKMEGYEHV